MGALLVSVTNSFITEHANLESAWGFKSLCPVPEILKLGM